MAFLPWRSKVDNDPLLTELHAELADHLAEVAEELARDGESPESLRARVDQRFGDLHRIVRQCRWEHRRELVLLRAVNVALLILLVVVGVALLVTLQRSQSTLTTEIQRLAGHVANAGDGRTATPPLAAISGRVYIGEPDQPVPATTVSIYETSPDQAPHQVRTVHADSQGRFHSGDLTLGDYFVMAGLVGPTGRRVSTGHKMQSEPLHLVEANTERHVELDLLAGSSFRVELRANSAPKRNGRALHGTVTINGREAEIGVCFAYAGPGYRLPWSPEAPLPTGTDWPIYGSQGLDYWDTTPRGYGYRPSDFPLNFSVPPGECHILVTVRDRQLLLGKSLASAMVAAEFYESEPTTLVVELPDELHTIERAGGKWNPLKLNVSVRPPLASQVLGRTPDESDPRQEASDLRVHGANAGRD